MFLVRIITNLIQVVNNSIILTVSILLLSSCFCTKQSTSAYKNNDEEISSMVMDYLLDNNLQLGKPCSEDYYLVNGNLFLYSWSKLVQDFWANQENKDRTFGKVKTIKKLISNSAIECDYKLEYRYTIDSEGKIFESHHSENRSHSRLIILSQVVIDKTDQSQNVFLSALYGSDTQHFRFVLRENDSTWEVAEHIEWFMNK